MGGDAQRLPADCCDSCIENPTLGLHKTGTSLKVNVMVDLRSPWQDLELPLGLPEEMSKLTEVQRLVLNMGGIIAWVLGF